MDTICDKVPENLKCPICFEIPIDKVFQCKDGHVICEKCFSQLTECPCCRVKYGKEKIRNRLLENLLDELELDCPYGHSGCRQKLNRKTVKEHIEKCCYNIAKFGFFINICQLFGDENCTFQLNHGNTTEAIQHFTKEHSITLVQDISTCSTLAIKNVDKSLFKSSDMYYFGTEIFDRRQTGGYAILLLAIFNKTEKSAAMIPLHMPYNNASLEKQVESGLQVEFSIVQPNSSGQSSSSSQNFEIPLKWAIAPIDILKVEKILPNLYPFRFPLSLLEKYCDEGNGSLNIQCCIKNEQSYVALDESLYLEPNSFVNGELANLSLEDETDNAGASAPPYADFQNQPTPPPPPPPRYPRIPARGRGPRGGPRSRGGHRRVPPPPPVLPQPLHFAPLPTLSDMSRRSAEQDKEKHFLKDTKCKKCDREIEKMAFKCLQCEDVIFCKRCVRRGEHNHLFGLVTKSTHLEKLKMAKQSKKIPLPNISFIDSWWDSYAFSERLNLDNKLKELNEKCAHCDDRRVAFICLECGPLNVPVCKSCTKKRAHNSDHVLAETGLIDRKNDSRRKFLLHLQLERNMRKFF